MDVRIDHKEGWAIKNWYIWTVTLEKTLESPLDCKEIKLVHPKGNQSWIFIGRTDAEADAPIFWPCDAKSWLIEKDPDAGKHWGQAEKGMTEDEMVRWHHWLNGQKFEQTLGDSQGERCLACCSPGDHKVRHDWASERQHGSLCTSILATEKKNSSPWTGIPTCCSSNCLQAGFWRRTEG